MKRERQHPNFHIAPGQECCQITGEQICVRACNVDVHIRLDIQTVYDLFKVGNFLNLIKEDVGSLSGDQPLFQICVQLLVIQQFFVFQFFKVHGYNLRIQRAVFPEPRLILHQQRGFPTTADAGHDFDDLFFFPADQLLQIFLALYQCRHLLDMMFLL